MDEDFEFVMVNSESLPKVQADKSAFEDYFKSNDLVVTFPNLGGDAQLIVPTEKAESKIYNHLANFVRKAPIEQVDKFWEMVGEAYEKSINEKPIWLSTAGLGISWLHVRIDSRPKYYRYLPYKG